jgi:hypothetical protein
MLEEVNSRKEMISDPVEDVPNTSIVLAEKEYEGEEREKQQHASRNASRS